MKIKQVVIYSLPISTENGFVYDSESGTWSHPTYTEGNTNYYLNQIYR